VRCARHVQFSTLCSLCTPLCLLITITEISRINWTTEQKLSGANCLTVSQTVAVEPQRLWAWACGNVRAVLGLSSVALQRMRSCSRRTPSDELCCCSLPVFTPMKNGHYSLFSWPNFPKLLHAMQKLHVENRLRLHGLSARLSDHNSVCLSVCPSVTWVDQSKTVQARITKASPLAAWEP